MSSCSTNVPVEAHVLRYLKSLPGYHQWAAPPLPPLIDDYLRHADQQQIMTVLAMALGRVLDDPDE